MQRNFAKGSLQFQSLPLQDCTLRCEDINTGNILCCHRGKQGNATGCNIVKSTSVHGKERAPTEANLACFFNFNFHSLKSSDSCPTQALRRFFADFPIFQIFSAWKTWGRTRQCQPMTDFNIKVTKFTPNFAKCDPCLTYKRFIYNSRKKYQKLIGRVMAP